MTPDNTAPAPLDLAETLTSRLCHDIAGLLGTLKGALDLALEGEAQEGDEAALLATGAAAQLTARLRLLRTAWGGGGGALDRDGLALLAGGLPGRERFTLDLLGLAGLWPEDASRLLLCLLMVAAGAARRHSAILAEGSPDRFTVTLAGTHPGWPGALAGPSHAALASPRQACAGLAGLIAARTGWVLTIEGPRLTASRPPS